jgi:HAD superfamily hydrolase (TIGR01509 family)
MVCKSASLVIFDCDGVLVDSEQLSADHMLLMLGKHGVNLPTEAGRQLYFGRRLPDVLADIESLIQRPLPSTFIEEFRRSLDVVLGRDLKAVFGASDALQKIAIPKCVASNGPKAKTKRSLELTGLLQHFKGRVFSAYEIDAWKPDPRLFLHAAEICCAKPGECTVVEDSPSGVAAGVAAGMRVLAYTPDGDRHRLAELGATTFAVMSDLPTLLGIEN